MQEYAEQIVPARFPPHAGMARVGAPHLTPEGFLDLAENVALHRRSKKRRPHKRRINHTAVGVPGFKLFRDAVIPYNRSNHFDSSAPQGDFHWEFWHFCDWTASGSSDYRIPHLFLSDEAAFVAGYGAGPGYAKVQYDVAPFVLNVARLSSAYYWELYIYSAPTGSQRITVPYKPGVRQHVSIDWDADVGCTLRVKYEGDSAEQTATAALTGERVNLTYLPWMMRGPATTAATPLDPPHFRVECLRLWSASRSAATIQAERDTAFHSPQTNLVAQWTGRGARGEAIDNDLGATLPIFFTGGFPSKALGALEIANRDLSSPAKQAIHWNVTSAASVDYVNDVHTSALADNYKALGNTAGGAFVAAASGGLKYAVACKFRLLGHNTYVPAGAPPGTLQEHGIFYGQFGISYDPLNLRIRAYDADAPAVIAQYTLPATPLPMESHVVGVERDGNTLYLYWDGALVNTAVGVGTGAGSLKVNYYGLGTTTASITAGVGNVLIEELAWFYGTPSNAASTHLITAFPRMGYLDRFKERTSGNDLIDRFITCTVTNGSATVVNNLGGASPRVGDFLIDTRPYTRARIYRVTAIAGTNITINQNYQGASGTTAFAISRCLYYARFADQSWNIIDFTDTSTTNIGGGRFGKHPYLPNAIDDDFTVLRPLWLANGVNAPSASTINLESSAHRERATRAAGFVRSNRFPCAGLARYRKGEDNFLLGLWGSTLYWLDERWRTIRLTGQDSRLDTAIACLNEDFWYPSTGRMTTPFQTGTGSNYFWTADIEPRTTRGKRVLLNWSTSDADGRLRLYIEDGRPAARVFYNAGSYATLQADSPVILKNQRQRIAFYLDFDNSGNSYIAVDGVKVSATVSGTWPGGGSTINNPPDSSQALFGINRLVADNAAIASGFKSFVGIVHQVLASTIEEYAFHRGMPSPQAFTGYSASAELVLLLNAGKGWLLESAQSANSTTTGIINGSRTAVPILEDVTYGDDDDPYSMDLVRGILYGTNGKGRHIFAEWLEDFDSYEHGWRTGFSGITPPHNLMRVTDSGSASSNITAGTYLIAAAFRQSSTGLQSNPSTVITYSHGGANSILVEDIPKSEDPRCDVVDVYMTQADGSFVGRVVTLPNGSTSCLLDYAPATIRAGEELSYRFALPPAARIVKFINGRTFWGGLSTAPGALAFNSDDFQEAWYGLNLLQGDGAGWSPIVGIGGQRGVVHAYTEDAIIRIQDGGGDIATFAKATGVAGAGAIGHHGILPLGGLEIFLSQDGIYAYDGNAAQPFGLEIEGDSTGIPALLEGFDPEQRALWSVWHPRSHYALWFFRRRGDADPAGTALMMSRRPGDSHAWSLLDFYDVSAAATFDSHDGIPAVALADGMGYAAVLEEPESANNLSLDLDGLDAEQESGAARTLEGVWGTTQVAGPLAGDGARGLVLLALNRDATTGIVTSYTYDRLLKTPAAATFAAGDLENASAGYTHWVLGGFRQAVRTGWIPGLLSELPKILHSLGFGCSALSGQDLELAFATCDGPRIASLPSWDSLTLARELIPMDWGFRDYQFQESHHGRAIRLELAYYGSKAAEIHEISVLWRLEGGEQGPGYGQP